MNAIAKQLHVSAQTILNWVRKFAQKTYEKPEPTEALVVEADEMWHYPGSKKTKFGSGKHTSETQDNLLTGNVGGEINPLLKKCLND